MWLGRIRRFCLNRNERTMAEQSLWYVMRDLKRANAKERAYGLLEELHFEVFTPMQWRLVTRQGRRIREEHPVIPDLLFVRAVRHSLDPIVEKTPTLQYRYVRGGKYCDPMVVAESDMECFIRAVRSSESPRYYLPEEITPAMYGRRIRIVGGPLDGCEGSLVTARGSCVRRLLVDLPTLLAVSVEVSPEYIQLVK